MNRKIIVGIVFIILGLVLIFGVYTFLKSRNVQYRSLVNQSFFASPTQPPFSSAPAPATDQKGESATDWSNISLVVEEGVRIRVFSSSGVAVGVEHVQKPLGHEPETAGLGIREFSLPEAPSDTYRVVLSLAKGTSYSLNAALYDRSGRDKVVQFTGEIAPGRDEVFTLSFDKENVSNSFITQVLP